MSFNNQSMREEPCSLCLMDLAVSNLLLLLGNLD